MIQLYLFALYDSIRKGQWKIAITIIAVTTVAVTGIYIIVRDVLTFLSNIV